MTDGPGCPGVGEFSNQAALSRFGPGCGTAREPSAALPMEKTSDRTSIAGIEIDSGSDGPSGVSCAASTVSWAGSCLFEAFGTFREFVEPGGAESLEQA